MKKGLLFGTLLALVVVIGSPFVSRALSLSDAKNESSRTVTTVSPSVDQEARDTKMTEDVQTKRAEIEQRMADKRAAIQEKLRGKRAESCEKKQASINQILDNRVSAASKHLEHFKDIQNKLVSFVEAKKLVIENATALELMMNDAQAAAQAAIDAAGAIDFVCADTDAAAPGKIVTEQVSVQKQALKDYRSAIKGYASAVKAAFVTSKTANDGESR